MHPDHIIAHHIVVGDLAGQRFQFEIVHAGRRGVTDDIEHGELLVVVGGRIRKQPSKPTKKGKGEPVTINRKQASMTNENRAS